MPYKTQHGSHYHETYGCHGATIPCDAAGLTPCSDCCEGKAGGSPGTTGTTGGNAPSTATSDTDATGTGGAQEPAIPTVSESDFRETFWKTRYAYVGRDDGTSRPFRIDVSSAEDGRLYWRMTAARSQIDDDLVPIGASFSDDLGEAYVPLAGEWTPGTPRISDDGTATGPTFATMGEVIADVNAYVAGLGITNDTDSIDWHRRHSLASGSGDGVLSRSSEATEIGIRAMSAGMPLAGDMTVAGIAERLAGGQGIDNQ